MDLKTIGSLSKTPPAPKPKPEPAPAPTPEPTEEKAPQRPVSPYTAMTRPAAAPAAPAKAKAKKAAPAKAKSAPAKSAPAAKPKKAVTASPAVPVEAEPPVTITFDDEQVQTDLPQLVPFGDPAARDYLGQQAAALRSNPMYRAAVARDELAPQISQQKEAALNQLREKTDYDIGVYTDAAARAELLRAINPDPVIMNNMPPNLDEESKRRYINTAKAVALNNLIEAKRLAPNIKLDKDSVHEAADLESLEAMLESLVVPKLRPYEDMLPGLNPLVDYFSSPETETKVNNQSKSVPASDEAVRAAQRAYSSSMAPYMEPMLRNRGAAPPNPQPVPMESPLPDFVNDNIFAPVYAYMDRKRAEAAAKERQPK